MIIGLTGPICAGKSALALYLGAKYNFKVVDLLKLFKIWDESLIHSSPKKKSEDDGEQNSSTSGSNTLNNGSDNMSYIDSLIYSTMSNP